MASKKAVENANRLKYIRALERFQKSIISYLSNNADATKEIYDKKVDNALRLLSRVDEVQIYKGELQDLESLVKKMISYRDTKEDIESIQNDLLYLSNQLDKSKNARRYKKDKHSKSKYNEWE